VQSHVTASPYVYVNQSINQSMEIRKQVSVSVRSSQTLKTKSNSTTKILLLLHYELSYYMLALLL